MIATIVRDRRTVKAANMNGKKIADATIKDILKLADYAPTHGRTEPWRFFVYTGTALSKFCPAHSPIYLGNTPEVGRKQQTFDNLAHMGDMASHLVIVVMKRTADTKIPMMEEYAAVSASVQNVLLGAEAMGLAAIWNTGGMALKPAMKSYLSLADEDLVVGLIYMGYADQQKKEALRNVPLEEKITWM